MTTSNVVGSDPSPPPSDEQMKELYVACGSLRGEDPWRTGYRILEGRTDVSDLARFTGAYHNATSWPKLPDRQRASHQRAQRLYPAARQELDALLATGTVALVAQPDASLPPEQPGQSTADANVCAATGTQVTAASWGEHAMSEQAGLAEDVGEPRVLPELRWLVPPLSPGEQDLLEQSLVANGGPRDALIAARIDDQLVLLDGHHRYRICAKRNLPHQVVVLEEITTIDAAKSWIIEHQLGRRNLTREAAAYLQGWHYNSIKGGRGGDHRASGHSGRLLLAKRYRIGERTVARFGRFAEQLDALALEHGDALRHSALTRDARLTMADVSRLSTLDKPTQEQVLQRVLRESQSVIQALKAIHAGANGAVRSDGDPDPDAVLEELAARVARLRRELEEHAQRWRSLGPRKPRQLGVKAVVRLLDQLHEALLGLVPARVAAARGERRSRRPEPARARRAHLPRRRGGRP